MLSYFDVGGGRKEEGEGWEREEREGERKATAGERGELFVDVEGEEGEVIDLGEG